MKDKMISILCENCNLEEDNNTKLPYTAYVTEYVVEGETRYDICMADKGVDVFDVYYDKYKKDFIRMTQSEGRVAPNRWNVQPPAPKKKKRRRRQEEDEQG
jgi:hypothetical protein